MEWSLLSPVKPTVQHSDASYGKRGWQQISLGTLVRVCFEKTSGRLPDVGVASEAWIARANHVPLDTCLALSINGRWHLVHAATLLVVLGSTISQSVFQLGDTCASCVHDTTCRFTSC